MIKVTSEADQILVAKLNEIGQGQLFDRWDSWSVEEQQALLGQLHSTDLQAITRLITDYREGVQRKQTERVLKAAEYDRLPESDDPDFQQKMRRRSEARTLGEKALREGRVALLMAAGGTGTRMGVAGKEAPKGTFLVGPVSGKSLLCFHCEKVRSLSRKYRVSLPIFIVTSPQTHDGTVEHLRSNNFFGLNRQDVKILTQSEYPVIDRRGRFVLCAGNQLALRPNGHGDALDQLLKDDVFKQLSVRAVEHVFFFQIDNPLVNIADPTFIGTHIQDEYEMSCKAVRKTDPTEKIGIFCSCDGVLSVVEYSELSPEDQKLRDAQGDLAFCAGNVAIHLFSYEFLKRIRENGLTLPFHAIDKTTPYLDPGGQTVSPQEPNTVAFESFIFDALAWSKKTLISETSRTDEFSPIKNASGQDSPQTARDAISRLHNRWLREIGAEFPDTTSANGGQAPVPVEISPLFANSVEELHEKITLPLEIKPNLYLE